jgi:transposase-like protein
VAQVFHIKAHYPDGVWWWAVGVLPFALCLETRLLHALVVALLGLWAGFEVLGFDHLGGWFFGRWDFLPNGAYSLPLLAAPGMVWAYRKQSLGTLALYIPLLDWWTVLQAFAWKLDSNPIYFIGAVGALMLVAAECHAAGSRFAIPYRYYGSLLVGGVLVPLSFYKFNQYLMPEWRALVIPPAVLARAEGRVEVATLAEEFGVTTETVRRDLTALERRGLLRRVHGGAIPLERLGFEPGVKTRDTVMTAEKERIAKAALAEVPEEGSILIDAGTTTSRFADALPGDRELTVVTDALDIAIRLAQRPRFTVLTLGGRVRACAAGQPSPGGCCSTRRWP